MHELGELPALDWGNVRKSFAVCLLLIAVFVISTHIGTPQCVPAGELCLRQWGYAAGYAVGTYFIVNLLTRVSLASTILRQTLAGPMRRQMHTTSPGG